jgi:hypothetical protein
MLMRTLLLIICILPFAAHAKEDLSGFGAGIQLGDPSGITLKFGKTTPHSVHALFGWADDLNFHVQADYLWNKYRITNMDGEPLHGYFGIGGRIQDRDHDNNRREKDDSATAVGVRFPGGIRWLNHPQNLEVFGELSVAMDIIPRTEGDIDFGIGFHYFF